MQSKNIKSMRQLVEDDVMRRKHRAKERFFSHRDEFGQWDPKNQRPELWNIFNGRKNMGEHFRVFPISVTGQSWMYGNI